MAGITPEERAEERQLAADLEFLRRHEQDEDAAFVNQHLEGWTDGRGNQREGFEFMRVSSMSDADFRKTLVKRRDLELSWDPEQTRRALARGRR